LRPAPIRTTINVVGDGVRLSAVPLSAVVLAGGGGRRMGTAGAAKPTVAVGGVPLLVRVLAAVDGARPRVVVGPSSLATLLPPDVTLTLESPPGGGPAAATAAGLSVLARADGLVALLAADLPFLTAEAVGQLVAAASRPAIAAGATPRPGTASTLPADGAVGTPADGDGAVDGAVAVDGAGRAQWLCGVWSVAALRRRIAAVGDLSGMSLRHLLGGLTAARIDLAARPGRDGGDRDGNRDAEANRPAPTFDCDTVDDLRRAEEWSHGEPR
jgi:molybdopterin-guanine dinucleotide biosynthesis protein A